MPGFFILSVRAMFMSMKPPYPDAAPPTTPSRNIYTVSRLNREAKALLEGSFPALWVEGEISNLSRPASGHLYFTLKDAQAQVRCALFRGSRRLLTVEPRDGMHVLARGRVSLYEGRGDFQLILEYLEEAGEGALRRAFEVLKQRLMQEGLFEAARKKPLPRLPRCIGLVTSPSGAVLHDIVTTLRRRFPAIAVRLYPVPVQGAGAAEKDRGCDCARRKTTGLRRPDRGARRRLARGPVGVQRGDRGARNLRLPAASRLRRRSRNRHHHRRLRRRRARADTHRRRRDAEPGLARMVRRLPAARGTPAAPDARPPAARQPAPRRSRCAPGASAATHRALPPTAARPRVAAAADADRTATRNARAPDEPVGAAASPLAITASARAGATAAAPCPAAARRDPAGPRSGGRTAAASGPDPAHPQPARYPRSRLCHRAPGR